MKKFKLLSLLFLVPVMLLASCRPNSGGGGGGNTDDPSTDPYNVDEDTLDPDDPHIRVRFYLDFNSLDREEKFRTYLADNGGLVRQPPNPINPPSQDFTYFAGWSRKEIIDDLSELWNFETDTISVKESVKSFNLFGIWLDRSDVNNG